MGEGSSERSSRLKLALEIVGAILGIIGGLAGGWVAVDKFIKSRVAPFSASPGMILSVSFDPLSGELKVDSDMALSNFNEKDDLISAVTGSFAPHDAHSDDEAIPFNRADMALSDMASKQLLPILVIPHDKVSSIHCGAATKLQLPFKKALQSIGPSNGRVWEFTLKLTEHNGHTESVRWCIRFTPEAVGRLFTGTGKHEIRSLTPENCE